ncbi:hypothetical protein WK17_21350 [Burkholderia multivorans]|nr:hypothetical protein WK17_21350 [Burkholderia multivorans]
MYLFRHSFAVLLPEIIDKCDAKDRVRNICNHLRHWSIEELHERRKFNLALQKLPLGHGARAKHFEVRILMQFQIKYGGFEMIFQGGIE